VLGQGQTADIVTDKARDVETFFQAGDQRPVADGNMRHIADDAVNRIDQPWQDNGNRDQLAYFALVLLNEAADGVKQRMFQRLLSAFRQGVIFLCQ